MYMEKAKKVLKMLIIDKVNFYTNKRFEKGYYSKNILLFWLLSQNIHLYQLFNILSFQHLKYDYFKAINKIVQNGNSKILKLKFLTQIISIYSKAFKKNSIKKFFKKTGIILFNPKIVI